MTLEHITHYLKEDEGLNPHQLSQHLLWLAGEYAFQATGWERIQKEKPEVWLKLRDQCTSDTQAERKWNKTESGINEIILRNKLRVIEKLMSSIKARLRVMESEARNQF